MKGKKNASCVHSVTVLWSHTFQSKTRIYVTESPRGTGEKRRKENKQDRFQEPCTNLLGVGLLVTLGVIQVGRLVAASAAEVQLHRALAVVSFRSPPPHERRHLLQRLKMFEE
jgi:hypothetical protein